MQDGKSNSGSSTRNARSLSGQFPSSCTMEEGLSDVIYECTEPVSLHSSLICAMRSEKHVYYTDLLGNPFYTPTIEMKAVDPHDCRQYNTSMECPRGRFRHLAGRMYTTDVPLDPPVEFPGAFNGIFVGSQTANSTNCLVEEVPLSVSVFALPQCQTLRLQAKAVHHRT